MNKRTRKVRIKWLEDRKKMTLNKDSDIIPSMDTRFNAPHYESMHEMNFFWGVASSREKSLVSEYQLRLLRLVLFEAPNNVPPRQAT